MRNGYVIQVQHVPPVLVKVAQWVQLLQQQVREMAAL
jgi:hypothetical protein